jgi:hypothetical protein
VFSTPRVVYKRHTEPDIARHVFTTSWVAWKIDNSSDMLAESFTTALVVEKKMTLKPLSAFVRHLGWFLNDLGDSPP